jgi:hypothetical protein
MHKKQPVTVACSNKAKADGTETESAIRDEEPFGNRMERDEHRLVFKNTACAIA